VTAYRQSSRSPRSVEREATGFDREESTEQMRIVDERITKVYKKIFPISENDP
jgi:hypothetical protein